MIKWIAAVSIILFGAGPLLSFEIPTQSKPVVIKKILYESPERAWDHLLKLVNSERAVIIHAEKASGVLVIKYFHPTIGLPVYLNMYLRSAAKGSELYFFAFINNKKSLVLSRKFIEKLDED